VNTPRVQKSDSYFTPYASNDIDVLLLTQIVIVRFENAMPSPKKRVWRDFEKKNKPLPRACFQRLSLIWIYIRLWSLN
jgi:hypothetical protein